MKPQRIFIGVLLLLVLFFVTSCAPVGMSQQQYGFLYGIVQIGLYAQHNTGSLYWLGFILGIILLFGGGGGSYATRRRWYN
jgi:hypothetical protein